MSDGMCKCGNPGTGTLTFEMPVALGGSDVVGLYRVMEPICNECGAAKLAEMHDLAALDDDPNFEFRLTEGRDDG